MHLSERWESPAWQDRLLRAALTPVSWLYAAGWQTYLAIYTTGLKRAKRPHKPVVCIGNLVTGGTGKSPLTLYIARLLRESGRDVVVSSSGYGSPASHGAQVAPSGTLSAREWGDEPAMFRLEEPDLPLIVGRRRVLAAQLCHEQFPGSILLLDDGFQHLPLHKDLTILVDPPRRNHLCLPAGPYREPRRNRQRADTVLPGTFTVVADPLTLTTVDGKSIKPEGEVSVLCALGHPASFLAALRETGVRVAAERLLPDHDSLTAGNLLDGLPPDLPIVVTTKDWVKLRDRPDCPERCFWIARHRVRVEPEEEFRRWIADKLDGFTS